MNRCICVVGAVLLFLGIVWAGEVTHRRDLVPSERITFVSPPSEKRFEMRATEGPGADTSAKIVWKEGTGVAETASLKGITLDACVHQQQQQEHKHRADLTIDAVVNTVCHAWSDRDGRAELEAEASARVEEFCDGMHTLIFDGKIRLRVTFGGGAPGVVTEGTVGAPRAINLLTEERPDGGGFALIRLQLRIMEPESCDYNFSALYLSTVTSKVKWDVMEEELKGQGFVSADSEHRNLRCDAPQ